MYTECRGASALFSSVCRVFSGVCAVFSGVSRVFPGMSRVSRCVRLVFR